MFFCFTTKLEYACMLKSFLGKRITGGTIYTIHAIIYDFKAQWSWLGQLKIQKYLMPSYPTMIPFPYKTWI